MTIRPRNHPGTNFCAIISTERMVVFMVKEKTQKAKKEKAPKPKTTWLKTLGL